MDPIIWLIGGMIGAALIILYYVLSTVFKAVPEEDRGYMDPLPPLVRLIWPMILFLEYHVTSRVESSKLEKMTTKAESQWRFISDDG